MANERVLPLEQVHNFRDYGGYATRDGGTVRRNLLFRSGHHAEATTDDLSAIDALALAHVVDLRGNGERESHPVRLPGGFAGELLHFDGETAGLGAHLGALDGAMTAEDAHSAMEKLYSTLPKRENLIWILKRYFTALAKGEGASLVHCHAGKDRTGMAVDLLHHALGVHPDDAMEDFLLTNKAGDQDARIAQSAPTIRARYGAVDDETVRVVMGVDARYLHAARKALVDAHGSVDAFLHDVLGVDEEGRKALRLHLVEM
ncbi:tyrosine-protein phosphatase [Parerythrobacter jejuensis]|uniref:Protein-tyrosine-phosphatase n=1 Tax=Parerythrobacter jejuensis TaxID=795812 RepID=A0A845AP77_9SPHN|nr:tyrosine-protein phosphatase [Parerythrobacter jejuensis]MXP32090.1 protein-tyrosine-phosphatase [Parerythrobacter jejuensis]